MQVVYSNHTKNTNKENAQLRHNNKELSNHIYRLIDEVKQLRSKIDTLKSCITDKDLLLGNFKDKIPNMTKMPEVNSERSNLIGDTDSSYKDDTSQSIESMKNMNPEGNVSPQVEKKIDVPNSSLDKSNSVISMGGIEAIPAMTSVLGSPKIPWMMLSLLIIVVILLRFIRPILNANKKSENLKYAQIR
ncbi:7657_t:CDS:2 [Entrophospora sp. SA101]|nr:7657_t:CDS:2 [Entrophospora sp. SA101]